MAGRFLSESLVAAALVCAVAASPISAASVALQAAQLPDPLVSARAFLTAFSKSPLQAKKLVADDALIIVGDIGGTYAEFVAEMPSGLLVKFQGCRVGNLAVKPVDPSMSLDEMFGTGRDRPGKGGKISVVEGQYNCRGPNDSSADSRVTIVFEGDRVAALALWGRR